MFEAFIVVGAVLSVIGWLWLLVEAFSEDLFWGVFCLVCGLGPIAFALLHPQRGGLPFAMQLVGGGVVFLGAAVSGP